MADEDESRGLRNKSSARRQPAPSFARNPCVITPMAVTFVLSICSLTLIAILYMSVRKETRLQGIQMELDGTRGHSTGLYWMEGSPITTYKHGDIEMVHSSNIGTYYVIPSDGIYVIYSSIQFHAVDADVACCQVHMIKMRREDQQNDKFLIGNQFLLNQTTRSQLGPVNARLQQGDKIYATIDMAYFDAIREEDSNYFGIYELLNRLL